MCSGVWYVEYFLTLFRRMLCCLVLFFQAEDGIRDLVRSRGLGDVYKRQPRVRGLLMIASISAAGFSAVGVGLRSV